MEAAACPIVPSGLPGAIRPWPFSLLSTASLGRDDPKKRTSKALNFNIYNFPLHSAGCFRETKKDLRKTVRHLEKTTKHLKKTTKHLKKIIRQAVTPSPALYFGKSGQKETEEALYLQEVLGLATANIQHFSAKSKSAQLRFNISRPVGELGIRS